MANPLDRTWYNTLVDDDGSGTTGTVWNKTQVDGLLDSVDASLVPLVDKTGPPAVLNEVALFNDADTIKSGSGLVSLGAGALGTLTAAGADNSAVYLSGSGAFGAGRGALLSVAGNQNGAPGFIVLQMGNTAGAAISFNKGDGTASLQILSNGVLSLLDGQLLFPATQKPSSDPNTFDDYREGVWSPTITGTGGASGQIYDVQAGYSLKWGRYVVLTFNVALSTLGTISGNVCIGNLPIPTDQSAYYTQVCSLQWHNSATPFVAMSGQLEPGSPYLLRLLGMAGAATSSIGAPLSQASLTNTTSLYGTIVYRTN